MIPTIHLSVRSTTLDGKDFSSIDFSKALAGATSHRNRIERMFNKLKQSRRIVTHYDKTALSFFSFLNIAASRIWVKDYPNKI